MKYNDIKTISKEEKGRDMAEEFEILDLKNFYQKKKKKLLLVKFNNKGFGCSCKKQMSLIKCSLFF